MIRENFWNLFGISHESTPQEIDRAYIAIRDTHRFDSDELRMAWKIIRDPFIRHTYDTYGTVESVIGAGFFDDRREPEELMPELENPNWLTTPVHKIAHRIAEKTSADHRPVILVSTGAFSPIHQGHIAMMDAARTLLENDGRFVAGGYLSPSHDLYVRQKTGIIHPMDVSHRIRLLDAAVADSDWLMADPWEARFNTVAITYSDVLLRLEKYLSRLFPETPFDLVYVFGSDNAGFVRGFVGKGSCVCILRPGYGQQAETGSQDPVIAGNPKIRFGSYEQPVADISSTKIAGDGDDRFVPSQAVSRYREYTNSAHGGSALEQKLYLLRDDAHWATEAWTTPDRETALNGSITTVKTTLTEVLRHALAECPAPDCPTDAIIRFVDLAAQTADVRAMEKTSNILNLDVCTGNGSRTFHLSRQFGACDGQMHPLHLVPRPGYQDIAAQIAGIPDGSYILVEDDIASGTTIRKAIELLPDRIIPKEKVSLLHRHMTAMAKNDHVWRIPMLDICDTRDFIAGARDAGLVVFLADGTPYRTPYALPYVSLTARAAIPPSMERFVSQSVWEMNVDFFSKIQPAILLSETDPAFRSLMESIGFSPDTSMEEICRWHARQLAVSAAP